MSDAKNISINYIELKEITEKRLLNRLKMKEKADQPYDYALFHAQGQAILDMWHEIAVAVKAPPQGLREPFRVGSLHPNSRNDP